VVVDDARLHPNISVHFTLPNASGHG